ncbi:hypothetical protein A2303_02905 [Candidatus Falkowbacteria bacterium RIFOXYB2_FULL_47_14]|uniref:Gcp-like domain-containing protein n=1 Tax=Candidatus Falkowbacteria bacterium RIFOXYA2_FULL_47_19 TaxID=1797994 RepID=A0A1F5SLN3_9BACT|nr:MAG: hypothetical protein A2227_01980 [Candidatus Falkowbacteria bacterium RIFOXYA2_FULL_47_19]OGF36265.1 MAG: hypothetical protein A2468_07650 [Candidatus Falkowbacteria bacterium RIFOXYC2_FULL_46_15]OGF43069.1 MAG: hypothetical protein A2303_02905 [Candidatus Falkowbacteria bacterium RIFOXYB2_FULL_47_14]
MDLFIDTTQDHNIALHLKEGTRVISRKKFSAKYSQAEKLLPAIKKILDKNKYRLKDIAKIIVCNHGGGFTALRIGVVTANALGYALGVPVTNDKVANTKKNTGKFSVIKPEYDREPNITYPRVTHNA